MEAGALVVDSLALVGTVAAVVGLGLGVEYLVLVLEMGVGAVVVEKIVAELERIVAVGVGVDNPELD